MPALITRLFQCVLAFVCGFATIPVAIVLAACDLLFLAFGRRTPPQPAQPVTRGASIVIPNWNGRDLLERYLPSVVVAASNHPDTEVILVDNGSTDGSAAWVAEHFPQVRLIRLPLNLGFGEGCNVGARAARNDILVLLNTDMQVEEDFLPPLLAPFSDPNVFAVSCQIFFTDPSRRREETGLTQFTWNAGQLRVWHQADSLIDRPFPCAYPGGGSCAIHRAKFLELGGFDPLFHPFYLEDTDLGYRAWKRGWKVLYQPASRVYHQHRGTIGRAYSVAEVERILGRNLLLFTWKNLHDWRELAWHFLTLPVAFLASALTNPSRERPSALMFLSALMKLPAALRARWHARRLATIPDREALRRTRGDYFRDRFHDLPAHPQRLRVLFVSPYPICPPVHGGAVLMRETCRHLAKHVDLHLLVLLEDTEQRQAHAELEQWARSVEYYVRRPAIPKALGSLVPHAVREFASAELAWIIQRKIYLDEIDVLQLEYTPMSQYGGDYHRLVQSIFEHDIYFQSVGRLLKQLSASWRKVKVAVEYMRALRYELRLLQRFDLIQVCSDPNASYLLSFRPELASRIDRRTRAGLTVADYPYIESGREPDSLLFVGSFRHAPNLEGLRWFLRDVFPRIRAQRPSTRLVVVGSHTPPPELLSLDWQGVELKGVVPDVRAELARHAVFVCPVLTGSGVRVKLLEAFASGIPVVSTRLGAEGLATEDGYLCALADDPVSFASKTIELLAQPDRARLMARRARAYVETHHDAARLIAELAARYSDLVTQKRSGRDRRVARVLVEPREVLADSRNHP